MLVLPLFLVCSFFFQIFNCFIFSLFFKFTFLPYHLFSAFLSVLQNSSFPPTNGPAFTNCLALFFCSRSRYPAFSSHPFFHDFSFFFFPNPFRWGCQIFNKCPCPPRLAATDHSSAPATAFSLHPYSCGSQLRAAGCGASNMPQVHEQIVQVNVIPQERFSDSVVAQIVDVPVPRIVAEIAGRDPTCASRPHS